MLYPTIMYTLNTLITFLPLRGNKQLVINHTKPWGFPNTAEVIALIVSGTSSYAHESALTRSFTVDLTSLRTCVFRAKFSLVPRPRTRTRVCMFGVWEGDYAKFSEQTHSTQFMQFIAHASAKVLRQLHCILQMFNTGCAFYGHH